MRSRQLGAARSRFIQGSMNARLTVVGAPHVLLCGMASSECTMFRKYRNLDAYSDNTRTHAIHRRLSVYKQASRSHVCSRAKSPAHTNSAGVPKNQHRSSGTRNEHDMHLGCIDAFALCAHL